MSKEHSRLVDDFILWRHNRASLPLEDEREMKLDIMTRMQSLGISFERLASNAYWRIKTRDWINSSVDFEKKTAI